MEPRPDREIEQSQHLQGFRVSLPIQYPFSLWLLLPTITFSDLGTLHKWNARIYALIHLASIHVGPFISHCSFPLLCRIPLCKYATFFSLLLMNIWVAFQSLAILNKTAMIVLARVFWYVYSFPWECA